MRVNKQIYEVFKSNIISYGLENSAKILGVDFDFLSNMFHYENVNYNDLRMKYTIKLREQSKKNKKTKKIKKKKKL